MKFVLREHLENTVTIIDAASLAAAQANAVKVIEGRYPIGEVEEMPGYRWSVKLPATPRPVSSSGEQQMISSYITFQMFQVHRCDIECEITIEDSPLYFGIYDLEVSHPATVSIEYFDRDEKGMWVSRLKIDEETVCEAPEIFYLSDDLIPETDIDRRIAAALTAKAPTAFTAHLAALGEKAAKTYGTRYLATRLELLGA